jgi:hypothetical protein
MDPVIHKTLKDKIEEIIPILPPEIFPAPALTQEQLDYIASRINVSGSGNSYFPNGW